LKTGTPIWPTFIINGVSYKVSIIYLDSYHLKGNLDPDFLFEAICAAYNPHKQPQSCSGH